MMLVLTAGWVSAQPQFLSPLTQAVVAPGQLRVVAKGAGKGQLFLNGKPVETASPVAGVFSAELKLAAGRHELLLKSEDGEAKAVVFAGSEHQGWNVFRQHPPVATCDTCHAVKNGEWATKRASLAPLCFACHERGRFPVTHTHNTDTLADCQNCHLPHGSQAKAHLKMAKETACKQCHN